MKTFLFTIITLFFAAPSFGQLDQLEITDADGNQLMLDSYLDDDRNHLIIFWASWCSICRNELGRIESFYDSWLNEYNTEVIAISMDSQSGRASARQLFENNDYPYDLIFAPASDVRDALGISSQPHTYLVDQDMNVVFYKRGFSSGDENELDAEIRNAFEPSSNSEPDLLSNEFKVLHSANGYRIVWDAPLLRDAQISIYNSLGQHMGSWNAPSGDNEILISLNQMENQGIILEVRSEGKQTSRVIR
ncbi:MAG TPA: TlpA disulfide reductase family protein [Saprospiraceae bacterium]|nr:TlpA disulfide reductase family protein [Saprospiraceae bacterium]